MRRLLSNGQHVSIDSTREKKNVISIIRQRIDLLEVMSEFSYKTVQYHFENWLAGGFTEREIGSERPFKLDTDEKEVLFIWISSHLNMTLRQIASWSVTNFGGRFGYQCIRNTFYI